MSQIVITRKGGCWPADPAIIIGIIHGNKNMKIYGVHKSYGGYSLYELRKGYNIHFWKSIGWANTVKQLVEVADDGPVFYLKKDGGIVQDEDMEELCEFSPP